MSIPEKEIEKISKALKNDGVIAFPTDTVWGLGCLVRNPAAVEKIYRIKSREKHKPLILLASRLEPLLPYVDPMPELVEKLVKKYFPGALTIVLKKSEKTPGYITSGYDTVGIRVSKHPIFIEMLEKAVKNHVLATTSANISGEKSVSCKNDVETSLGNDVDYILDDYGILAEGKESSVVYIDKDNKIKVLREGAIDLGEYIQ